MSRDFAEEHKSVFAQGHKVLELVWETRVASAGSGSRVWSLFPKYAYPNIRSRTQNDDKVSLLIKTLSTVPLISSSVSMFPASLLPPTLV